MEEHCYYCYQRNYWAWPAHVYRNSCYVHTCVTQEVCFLKVFIPHFHRNMVSVLNSQRAEIGWEQYCAIFVSERKNHMFNLFPVCWLRWTSSSSMISSIEIEIPTPTFSTTSEHLRPLTVSSFTLKWKPMPCCKSCSCLIWKFVAKFML